MYVMELKKTDKEKKERKYEMYKKWAEINRPRKTIKDNPNKICCNCKIEKPRTLEYFRKRSDSNNFRSECKECFDEKSKKRHIEFYKNNTDKEKEREKEWIYKNKEQRAKTVHESYLRNIEKQKKYDKKRINELTDSIIINRLVSQTSLNRNEIPIELIETKRLLTQLKRTLKNGN